MATFEINCKHYAAFLIFFLSATLPSYSQSDSQLVLNYKKALGNSADESAFQTLECTGDFTTQKLKFPARLFFKTPTHLRMEMKFQALTFLVISNDSLKWEYNPIDDKHTLTSSAGAEDAQNTNNTFDFVNYDLLHYKERNHQVKVLKKSKLDSLNVTVVELTKNSNKKNKVKLYINTETSLIHKVEDEKGYRYFADYIHDNGFVFPRFIIDSNPNQMMEIQFRDIKINTPLSDTLFVIPKIAFEKSHTTNRAVEALITKADQAYNRGQYDSALLHYSHALKQDGTNYRAFNSRGLTKIELSDFYDAISDFNRAIEIDPKGSKAYNNRGLAKFYLGDRKGAIQDYSKAINLTPDFLIAFKNRGNAYFQIEDYENAAHDFSEATKLNPEDGEAHYSYGVATAQLDNYEEALTAYDVAAKHGFLNATVYNYKGVSEFKLARYDQAKESFLHAIKLDADNLQYLENYGRTLYELEDYGGATEQFEKYLKKKNDKAEIHNMIGLCKFRDENFKAAIADFSKAIELNGSEATYYDNRAASKEMIEDYVGAINDYTESIRIYPNDARVFYKRGLVKLHTSKKIEGCLDLATANEMSYEPARDAIVQNCN